MKFFKPYLFIAFLFVHAYCNGQNPSNGIIHFISLGKNCEVATQLQKFKLRSRFYPFDWMASENFSGILLAIQTDLKYFLDPNVLTHQEFYIENTLYQFKFNHFFPLVGKPITEEVFEVGTIVPNFIEYLPFVKKVQKKRIKNLLNALASPNDFVVFIRTHCLPEEAEAFVKLIRKKYPCLHFLLTVVHEQPHLNEEWNIPHVLNFYSSQKKSGIFKEWLIDSEWQKIFNLIHAKLKP